MATCGLGVVHSSAAAHPIRKPRVLSNKDEPTPQGWSSPLGAPADVKRCQKETLGTRPRLRTSVPRSHGSWPPMASSHDYPDVRGEDSGVINIFPLNGASVCKADCRNSRSGRCQVFDLRAHRTSTQNLHLNRLELTFDGPRIPGPAMAETSSVDSTDAAAGWNCVGSAKYDTSRTPTTKLVPKCVAFLLRVSVAVLIKL